jgi:hypothetical protein
MTTFKLYGIWKSVLAQWLTDPCPSRRTNLTWLTPAYTAGDMKRGDTRTYENGAYHVATGWCEVDAHWCQEPEPQADPTT